MPVGWDDGENEGDTVGCVEILGDAVGEIEGDSEGDTVNEIEG